ncbi:MAG: helix-turn-helix domain-containing protein [Deltaproteobacteria bacterium]|nr:helix-turn-helix domain-containing protein [Deltaproteobacteria bacterium]
MNSIETIGAYLKRQRTMRQIGLEDIAVSTKIHLKYLQALERDNLEVLPGHTFAKGFIQSYARAIGLDIDDALLHFEEYLRVSKNPIAKKNGKNGWLKPMRSAWKPWVFFALFLVTLTVVLLLQ